MLHGVHLGQVVGPGLGIRSQCIIPDEICQTLGLAAVVLDCEGAGLVGCQGRCTFDYESIFRLIGNLSADLRESDQRKQEEL